MGMGRKPLPQCSWYTPFLNIGMSFRLPLIHQGDGSFWGSCMLRFKRYIHHGTQLILYHITPSKQVNFGARFTIYMKGEGDIKRPGQLKMSQHLGDVFTQVCAQPNELSTMGRFDVMTGYNISCCYRYERNAIPSPLPTQLSYPPHHPCN